MSSTERTESQTTEIPESAETFPDGNTPVRTVDHVVVDRLSPAALEQLDEHADETAGGSRLLWFLIGAVAALAAGAIAAVAFLAVTDDDDDGVVDLEVPTVDVNVDG